MKRGVFVVLLAAACSHAPPVMPPGELDPQALLEAARAAHRVPETLSGDAKAFVDAPQNGGRYALRLAVKRPASIHLEANTPIGDPAAILVADKGRFALLDLRANVFYRGPATPRNLSRLLPAPLTPEELVAFLTGTFPELPGARVEAARLGDRYRLTFYTQALKDEIELGGDLRVEQVRRLGKRNELLWSVRLQDHDDSSGANVPTLIHLSVPAEKTEVDLQLKGIIANKPPPAGAFLLGVPKGMQVEEVP